MTTLTLAARIVARLAQTEMHAIARRAARIAVLAVLALILALLALGCLAAAAVLALAPVVGGWQAALITGGGLLLLAILALLATRLRGRRRTSDLTELLQATPPLTLVLGALAAGMLAGRRSSRRG